MAGWNADTAAGPLMPGTVTLVEGSSFCISSANGDIHPGDTHGVSSRTRILSCWELTVNGESLEPLAAKAKEPYRKLFVGRVPRSDGHTDSPLIVERIRELGTGLQEQITVRNYSSAAAECVVSIRLAVDFADLFEVKEVRLRRNWKESYETGEESLTIYGA